MAGLHSGSGLSKMFETLHEKMSRVKNINRLTAFKDSGIEQDQLKETMNRLLDFKEAYETQYE